MSKKTDATISIQVPLWVLEAIKEEAEKKSVSIQTFTLQSIIQTITKK
jgi:predicted DNA binding CopG/RHH family protein